MRITLEKIETIIDCIKIIIGIEINILSERTRKEVETGGETPKEKEGKKRKMKTAMILTGLLKISQR